MKLPGRQIVTFSEPGQFEQFNGGAYYRFIAADGRTRVYDKQGNVIGEGRIPPATNPFAPKPNQPVTRPSQVTLPRNLTGVNG